jgi:hypothetical protein
VYQYSVCVYALPQKLHGCFPNTFARFPKLPPGPPRPLGEPQNDVSQHVLGAFCRHSPVWGALGGQGWPLGEGQLGAGGGGLPYKLTFE